MKRIILLTALLAVVAGVAQADWVSSGTTGFSPSLCPHVFEIYLADQNTLYFSVKDTITGNPWIYCDTTNQTVIRGTPSNIDWRLFKVDALEVGHGFLMQIHAELLSAMANNKQIGFCVNLGNRHVTQLTIYNQW